ncbi:pantothenate kinase 3 [Galendromus occidentalis]|uniref:pantothenate kinase n=1 Tax=Galendromus occidentalis TaxID=34638 RepID=A0AAJ7L4F7_9ACAR|nr:pantothenate kinase 3 [Galendromus occidentalis]
MRTCELDGQAGTLHFIHFSSTEIFSFLRLAESMGISTSSTTICATGGGAQLLEDNLGELKHKIGTKVHKYDELDSLLCGIHYIESCKPLRECFYFEMDAEHKTYTKTPFDFSDAYPYLAVNIGSGVSMLAVYSPTEYRRITGTRCESFEEAIELAEKGDSGLVDKLVRDIYGGDYPKFNLRADTVASSFGNMCCKWRRELAKREDLARATLTTVTNNIASIARLCAVNEKMQRIVFVGNFLRYNALSMHMLTHAMDFWSRGSLKALFLEHEGYFGAVGCIVEHLRSSKKTQ